MSKTNLVLVCGTDALICRLQGTIHPYFEAKIQDTGKYLSLCAEFFATDSTSRDMTLKEAMGLSLYKFSTLYNDRIWKNFFK